MQKLSNNPNLSAFESRVARFADHANEWLLEHQILVAAVLILGSILFFVFIDAQPTRPPLPRKQLPELKEKTTDMAALTEEIKLDPPKDTPFTTQELKKFDGSVEGNPIYVAIKGKIFDVSAKKDVYGVGGGYHIFAGKDASRGLGKSSLKPEDAVADYSTLDASEMTVLEDWVKFFTKRYNIIGQVVD